MTDLQLESIIHENNYWRIFITSSAAWATNTMTTVITAYLNTQIHMQWNLN